MQQNKYKIIALVGKSGAGKDTILKELCKNSSFHKIITSTTRPKRDYEKQDIDYHFLTIENFSQKVLNGDMIEATSFNNNWFYGTDINDLREDKINVGVFNPAGIECIIEDNRLDLVIIYVTASEKTRLLRNLNREENPNCHEICRRFLADEKDFSYIESLDNIYIYQNENKNDLQGINEFIQLLNF